MPSSWPRRLTPRFDDDAEESAFQSEFQAQALAQRRGVLLLGATMYGAVALLDWYAVRSALGFLLLVRFGIALPALILTLALSYTPWGVHRMQAMAAAAYVVAGLGVASMIVVIPVEDAIAYTSGQMVVLVFALLLRFTPRLTAMACLTILIAHVAAFAAGGRLFIPAVISATIFLACSTLAAIGGSIWADMMTRAAFHGRREAERTRDALASSLEEVQALSGLLPICAWCKKIRDDSGYWQQLESYIAAHSEAEFTHGICPGCLVKLKRDPGAATGG